MGYKNSDNTNNKFSRKSMSPSFTGGKGRKTVGKKVKKTIPRKTVNWSSYDVNSDSNEDSDEESENENENENDSDNDDEDDDETEHHHLDGLYSLMGKRPHDSSSNGDDDDDDDDDNNNKNIFSSTSSDGDSNEAMFSSSDDDSDVDFVKLQAQQKAHALKIAKARKGLKSKPKNESNDNAIASSSESESNSESDNEEDDDDVVSLKKLKPRKKSFLKYGRRRSDAVLPDINFKFEFDTGENDELEAGNQETHIKEPEEEDIGEEVDYSPENPVDSNNVPSLEFEFDHHLIEVPKINEEELNSDEDYEIDDNELLATLQAENDAEEFLPPITKGNSQPQRNDSLISSTIEEEENDNDNEEASKGGDGDDDDDDDDDDDENDPFLKEEEKYLVNEFETNGFDENEEDEDEDDLHTFDSDFSTTNRIVNSFKGIGEDRSKPIVKYESSVSGGSDYDEDDYIDLINFDVPLFDDKNGHLDGGKKNSHHKGNTDKLKKDKVKQRANSNHNSDEDDDSYLWNYFFSSDNDSSSEETDDKNNSKTVNKSRKNKKNKKALTNNAITGADELFEQIENDNTFKSKSKSNHHGNSLYKAYSDSPMTIQDLEAEIRAGADDDDDDDDDYDSSESTDVDESLPKSSSNNNLVGSSKKATEVLSSKTADYRPPKLGSWVTVDCKPFGVIDGLSTRTLQLNKSQEPRSAAQSGTSHSTSIVNSSNGSGLGLPTTSIASSLAANPRKSIVVGPTNVPSLMISSDDLALGLDELLNVSELDNDDENDVKIWRDFNNNQNKKKIPLGAFRNKSVLYNNHIYQDDQHHHLHRRNSNADKKFNGSGHIKKQQPIRRQSQSKIERRRASIVEAVSQGYRPTKSGLFSETALADVEELLGDDRDLMELIQGL